MEKARRYAAKQLGLLARADLERFELSERWRIQQLCRDGELERVLPRVWRIRGSEASEQQQWLAALKWAGGGTLSHATAARYHALDGFKDPSVHITLARRGVVAPPGVVVHEARKRLPASAVIQRGPLRFTSVERTLLDLAAEAGEAPLQMAVESAWRERKIDPAVLLAQLKLRRRKGSRKVRRLLRGAIRRGRPLESPLEVIVWRALRAARLPRPQVQVEVPDAWGYTNRADFVFQRERVIVEALGWEWHRERFEEDAERTARLVASGYVVLPVTWRMMKEKPELALAWIATALTNGKPRRRK